MSSFLSNRELFVVVDWKTLLECPVNVGVLQGSVLGSTLLLLFICDLPDNFICNITIYADNTTLCSLLFVEFVRRCTADMSGRI